MNSCARCTVRPNKLKRQSVEQKKFYHKTMKVHEVAHVLKSFELLQGLRQSIFKGQVGAGRASQVGQ